MQEVEKQDKTIPCEIENKLITIKQKDELNTIFQDLCIRFKNTNKKIMILAPTYYPETCSILKNFSKAGIETLIVGGKGGQLFEEVEQTSADVPSNVDSECEENTKKIINHIPLERLHNKKVYLYQFMHYEWKNFLEQRLIAENEKRKKEGKSEIVCEIVADMTQGFESFFEGKHNLPNVLSAANLEKYKIPCEIVNSEDKKNFDENTLNEVYNKFKGNTGKIVLQLCGDRYQEVGGGEGTKIVKSKEEFIKAFKDMEKIEDADIKLSEFIVGIEGNMSFITLPQTESNQTIARIKNNYNTESELTEKAKKAGISDSTVICGRMTLKCVGEPLLTSKSGSGVGNDVGYIHTQEVRNSIKEIGMKLGKHMAKLGKWGLAGCDIKVTPDGRVFVIEINNRQQGPTAQMSEDSEANGLPSLIKMQTIYAFGSAQEVKQMHETLKGHEEEISNGYSGGIGSFYVKVAVTDKDKNIIKKAFKPGFYKVTQTEQGWQWDLDNPITNINQKQALEYNKKFGFNGKDIILQLTAGAFSEGDKLKSGTQLCRIIGLSSERFPAPFEANSDKTNVIIQSQWRSVINEFYRVILGREVEQNTIKDDLFSKIEKTRITSNTCSTNTENKQTEVQYHEKLRQTCRQENNKSFVEKIKTNTDIIVNNI
ncbi:MAG TPA: hypothetical protein VLL98_04925 [Rickettsiales bacterium]|nr:hypothetical protein [Rickettsiales bacterium]